MKNRILYLLIGLIFGVTACGQSKPFYSEEDLALRRDIAEMLIVGFRGTELNDSNHIVRDIKEYGIGGVILFEYDAPSQSRPRNISSPDQLKRLCETLQSLSEEKLFISIDQEGGKVSRLKEKYGFPSFASAEKTAKTPGFDSVRFYARRTAQLLHSMGINLNFAPCVDLNVNPNCPIIGKLERSFSANPLRVAACANVWIEEQSKENIVSCIKHFPGHGSSMADSHLGLADVSTTWQASELIPYEKLIKNGNGPMMIMTTHVFNAQLDSVFPATLSPYTLTTLLREKLGYDGVIITDDLAMGAMTKQYDYEEILERSINAGADILCLSNNGSVYNSEIVPETIETIFRLVKENRIKRTRIHQSAERIRRLKAEETLK